MHLALVVKHNCFKYLVNRTNPLNIVLILLPLIFTFAPLAFADSTNIGTVYWKQEIVTSNSFAEIYVIDDDMNKKKYPNFADKFTISVWSDTSPQGLEIEVVENGVYSGIFKGSVYIADSGNTENNRLVSSQGDILYAMYTDNTVKDKELLEIVSTAIVKIPGKDMEIILRQIDPSMRNNHDQKIQIPEWIKTNAGWWADGAISDSEFVSGIQHLIKDGILSIPPTASTVTQTSEGQIPEWIKTNAGWWADGAISDSEFVSGIQHLIGAGIITISSDKENHSLHVPVETITMGEEMNSLYSDLEECAKIVTAYKRIDCEKPIKNEITLHSYKLDGKEFVAGPITYYWKGIDSEGNDFSVTPTGQAVLSIRMLAENTSSEIVTMNCTSPQICAYDVFDGEREFKYSGMDFTSGLIGINPHDSREFNMLFGPNIGYGGTKFEYDPSKEYIFRVNEGFGNASIPLELN